MNYLDELNDHFDSLGGDEYRQILEGICPTTTQQMMFDLVGACACEGKTAREAAEFIFATCRQIVSIH